MGELYDNYEIIRQIGTGGFSRVYKAAPKKLAMIKAEEGHDEEEDFSVDELVAVKVVRSRDYDCELKRVADNEVELLKALTTLTANKDHIVQLIDVYVEPRRIAIVMEFLEGGELFERIISRTKYSERDAAMTIKCVVNALNAMHGLNIIHRDIKPENLVYKYKTKLNEAIEKPNQFVDDTPDLLKLMDFGLGLNLDGKDPHQGALYVGTPGYIAPEVISNGEYSPKSDIFAMGVILFILLSGRMPFSGKTSAVINTRILSGDVRFKSQHWDGISNDAKDLVKRMLQPDPEKRISGPEILEHAWLQSGYLAKLNKKVLRSVNGIKDYYAHYKFGENVKRVLTDVGNNLKSNLHGIVNKAMPGFPVEDIKRIKEAFIDENQEIQNPDVTRAAFRDTMEKLGFKDLRIDDIFDAILEDKPIAEAQRESTKRIIIPKKKRRSAYRRIKDRVDSAKHRLSIKRLSKRRSTKGRARGSTRESTKLNLLPEPTELEALDDRENDTIKLDELLIGLSTVATMESTEVFLKFLFDLFNSKNKDPLKKPGLTEKGFNKVARVLANRSARDKKDNPKSKRERTELATDIALMFSSVRNPDEDDEEEEEQEDTEEAEAEEVVPKQAVFVSFEEFHMNVNKFGKEVFEAYLKPQWKRIDAAGKYLFGEGEDSVVAKGLDYVSKMGHLVEDVQGKWRSKKNKKKEEEDADI